MSFLRPLKMVRVGIVGLKDDREAIIGALHDLRVAQVEPIAKESLEFVDAERGSDRQREVGDQLIRFRGLRSALPATPGGPPQLYPTLDALLAATQQVPIDEQVGALKREEDALLTERKGLADEVALLQRHPYYADRLEYLWGAHVLAFFGEAKKDAFGPFRAGLPADAHLVVGSPGETVPFLVVVPTAEAEAIGRSAQKGQIPLTVAPRRTGTPAETVQTLDRELQRLDTRLTEIRGALGALAATWYPTVLALEEGLTIENRKLEVYTRLGAGARTFSLEAWLPRRDRERVAQALTATTGGRVYFYDIPSAEEPPTFLENPPGVRWFEFFIRFYSLPQATEWDPTWVFAVVFPIFFGFMLGDWGYGLVILGFCLWMIAGFPGRQHVPNALKSLPKRIMGPDAMRSLAYALVPGCFVAIAAGIVFNGFFGYHLLPWTYIDPVSRVGATQLLLLAGYIGLAMVTFGFGLGALKEYFHHHRGGVIAKTGGIVFAWSIALFGLGLIRHQPVLPTGGISPASWLSGDPLYVGVLLGLIVGLLMLIGGEGFQQGLLGLIEIVSHILSYTRLVGILLASVVLTLVAFDLASILRPMWGGAGIVVGIFIVLMIEVFNIVLGVFEPGIQGARLIFVENFSKYFSGNGKPFRPLGSARQHTVAPPSPAPPAP